MPTRHRRNNRLAFLSLPLIFAAVTVYFGWQSTRGAYGEDARQQLIAERKERQAELAGLVMHRETLETQVVRLRTDALDADLLDERVRSQLNMTREGDLIIMHPAVRGAGAAPGGLADSR